MLRKTCISYFRIPGQSLIKENCHTSRTIDDTDMKLGPVTKLDKRNKTPIKKMTMTSCRKIMTSLSFFRFNPHMPEIFLQRYCMKWVPGDPLKEMIN